MKRHPFLFTLLFLACSALIFQSGYMIADSTQTRATKHHVNMTVSPEVATPGSLLNWEFDVVPGTVSGNVDIYVVLTAKGIPLYFFNPYGFSTQAIPYQINTPVSNESCAIISDLLIPRFQFELRFYIVLVKTGQNPYDMNNWASNIAVKPVYFSLLSPAQEVFIDELGHPPMFIKTFSDDDGQLRVDETWIYIQQGVRLFFTDGAFINQESIITTNMTTPSSYPLVEHYAFDLTEQDIINTHGQPKEIKTGPLGSGTFYSVFQTDRNLIYNGAVFGFSNGKLVFMITPP